MVQSLQTQTHTQLPFRLQCGFMHYKQTEEDSGIAFEQGCRRIFDVYILWKIKTGMLMVPPVHQAAGGRLQISPACKIYMYVNISNSESQEKAEIAQRIHLTEESKRIGWIQNEYQNLVWSCLKAFSKNLKLSKASLWRSWTSYALKILCCEYEGIQWLKLRAYYDIPKSFQRACWMDGGIGGIWVFCSIQSLWWILVELKRQGLAGAKPRTWRLGLKLPAVAHCLAADHCTRASQSRNSIFARKR